MVLRLDRPVALPMACPSCQTPWTSRAIGQANPNDQLLMVLSRLHMEGGSTDGFSVKLEMNDPDH